MFPNLYHGVHLFRTVYDVRQLITCSDHDLDPLLYPNTKPERRELQAYEHILSTNKVSDLPELSVIGVFSDSFTSRTGLGGDYVKKAIAQYSDKDLFVFSAAQYNASIFYETWDQAEFWHEGIRLAAVSANLTRINSCQGRRQPSYTWSYCNFWAARKPLFMRIIQRMLEVESILSKKGNAYLPTFWRSPFHDSWNAHNKVDYVLLPFIIERVLTSFLLELNPSDIYYWRDPRPLLQQVENVHGLADLLAVPIENHSKLHAEGFSFDTASRSEFYQLVWSGYDQYLADLVVPGSSSRLRTFFA